MTLKEKYGNEMVLTVPADKIEKHANGPWFYDEDIDFCARKDGVDMLRYEAEEDPSHKQLVVYAVLRSNDFKTFVTHRLAGDARLTGKYSIGTGGHVAPNESFTETMIRELKEEVGLDMDNVLAFSIEGYILDESSPVNSVHLGVVYQIIVRDRDAVKVAETDKLAGEWLDANELAKLKQRGALESWSEITYNHII